MIKDPVKLNGDGKVVNFDSEEWAKHVERFEEAQLYREHSAPIWDIGVGNELHAVMSHEQIDLWLTEHIKSVKDNTVSLFVNRTDSEKNIFTIRRGQQIEMCLYADMITLDLKEEADALLKGGEHGL